ncbi:MAG: GDSL-type esterase/lipase family protein [Planctomycetota bacterium]
MPPEPRRRRWLALLIGVGLGLLAFEGALQLIGYWVWSRGDRAGAGSDDARVILCVGDSYTWGLGATDASGSYPQQLAARLQEAGHGDWTVVNGGWPGTNSNGLVAALGEKLAQNRPDIVCLLVGANDAWSRPALWDGTAAAPPGFPLRWRTGRLVQLAWHWLRARPSSAATDADPPGFLGTWHDEDRELAFLPDGRLLAAGIELRWSQRGDAVFVRAADQPEERMDWSIVGDALVLRSPTFGEVTLQRGPAPAASATPLARGLRALEGGRPDEAVALLEQAAAGAVPEAAAEALAGLARARVLLGDPPGARAAIATLRERREATPTLTLDAALAEALAAVGEREEAVRLAAAVLERGDERTAVRAWPVLFGYGDHSTTREVALDAVRNAERRGSLAPDQRWQAAAFRAKLLLRKAPRDSLASLMEALDAGAPETYVLQALHEYRAIYTPELAEAYLRTQSPGPPRERHEMLLAKGRAGVASVTEVLRAHYVSAIALCRRHGAEPVLLTYPLAIAGHDATVESVAAELDVPWVSVRPAFDALLRTRSRQELFVPDGHCTDEGYGVMAAKVFDVLTPLLRAR